MAPLYVTKFDCNLFVQFLSFFLLSSPQAPPKLSPILLMMTYYQFFNITIIFIKNIVQSRNAQCTHNRIYIKHFISYRAPNVRNPLENTHLSPLTFHSLFYILGQTQCFGLERLPLIITHHRPKLFTFFFLFLKHYIYTQHTLIHIHIYMLRVKVRYLEKMDHELDCNEYYLFNNMKNVGGTRSSFGNNNKKKRWSKHRGIGRRRRGLNLRVKLKAFWVRDPIAHWFRLRLLCLRTALKSLLSNFSTITSRRNKNKSSNTTCDKQYSHYQSSYARSNSFYAEAIADCLEFIKRSSSNHHHHQDQQQSHKLLL